MKKKTKCLIVPKTIRVTAGVDVELYTIGQGRFDKDKADGGRFGKASIVGGHAISRAARIR